MGILMEKGMILKALWLTTGKIGKEYSSPCHCHEIYRVEAVGLKNSNNTLKITIFVNMWNLGWFL